MKSTSKKIQLETQRALLVYTLDFLITHYTGYFVIDGFDSQKQYYTQEKAAVEKCFAQGSLLSLNKALKKFQKNLYLKRDINYPAYIEHITASPFVLYQELSKNIQRILTQKMVSNEEDVQDVEFLFNIYKTTTDKEYDLDELNEYVEIFKKKNDKIVRRNILIREGDFSITQVGDSVSKLNPKRKYSPNGKNWVELNRSGKEDHAVTYIVAGVDGSNGPIYSIKGKGEIMKSYWADNNTIVIHTFKGYKNLLNTKILKTKHSEIHIKYLFE